MAHEAQLAVIKQGVAAWNAWREANPDVVPDLSDANLIGANLIRASFTEATLIDADLTDADLTDADLHRANLTDADLGRADLRRANLRRAYLRRVDLSRANLIGADLSGADLSGADLSEANLTDADLTDASLRMVNLSGAYLTGANLRMVNLSGAALSGAYLSRANITEASIANTIFANTDLSEVQGLDMVVHHGPSTIGIDTLQRSGGNIPEVFLRGCGVPDSWIEYLPSLLGALQPIQFYSCFISYSSNDEAFAKRLHQRMQAEHLRVWFAPEDMKGGDKLHRQIEHAIQVHDRLLLVLSEGSIQSEWVQTELYHARQAELRENRRKLFPIRLCSFEALRTWRAFDADTGKDLAREVREYFIPDFSTWKDHDAFEAAFTRLLNDLKAVNAPPIQRATPALLPAPTPVAPAPERAHLESIIATKTRRLQHLEQQQALTGATTPPEILIQLEDLRQELATFKQQFEGMRGEEGNRSP